ncbi:MAG: ABC transporter permease [Acaryochloris sp. RU_4_1]|nr:ABC transporter permease [Acaryochloris sp. RU_4_1]NJR53942.1 ABC transporter permease [Acaryochloris sp. CRU_2_0]
MLTSLPLASTDELFQRLGVQPTGNIWTVLVVDALDMDEVIEDLSETIAVFTECPIKVIPAQTQVSELIEQVQQSSEDYLLLWAFAAWTCEDWQKFDAARSQLIKPRGGMLVLSSSYTSMMLNCAPNFCSWVGSRFYSLAKDREFLTEQEREIRLAALREWFGRSDAEVIESAESHQLPATPEYGEWLVLLGRGDLIER